MASFLPLWSIKCHHVIRCSSLNIPSIDRTRKNERMRSVYIYFCFLSNIHFFLGTLMSSAAIDSNGNHMHNGTLPLRSSGYSCPNSTQVTTTTMSTMDRPNSNSSNVYQTIDADRLVSSYFNHIV